MGPETSLSGETQSLWICLQHAIPLHIQRFHVTLDRTGRGGPMTKSLGQPTHKPFSPWCLHLIKRLNARQDTNCKTLASTLILRQQCATTLSQFSTVTLAASFLWSVYTLLEIFFIALDLCSDRLNRAELAAIAPES